MSVVPASSVKVGTLVDGTLRLTCDIEPGDAQAAFALFAAPGTPMALAALKPARSKPEKAERERLGPLCEWAVMRCKELHFREWLERMAMTQIAREEDASAMIYRVCDITSRKELDTNEKAAEVFNRKIREPYRLWLEGQDK